MEFRNVGPLNLGMGRKNSDDRDLKIHRFGVGERVSKLPGRTDDDGIITSRKSWLPFI